MTKWDEARDGPRPRIKVGDVVHVRATVDRIGNIGMPIIKLNSYEISLHPEDIVHVEPRVLQVGDKVTQRGYHANDPGAIVAIDEGRAWVRLTPSVSGQSHYSDRVSNLVRA